MWHELSALTKVERSLGAGLSTVVNPDVIMSCLTCNTLSVWLHNTCRLAHHWQAHRQTHLPDAASLNPSAVPIRYWRELLYVERPCRDTETSISLASHLVRVPNSRFGGNKVECVRGTQSLTKVERSLGSGLFTTVYTQGIHFFVQLIWGAHFPAT